MAFVSRPLTARDVPAMNCFRAPRARRPPFRMTESDALAALRHRDFRVYQAARMLVTIATQMQSRRDRVAGLRHHPSRDRSRLRRARRVPPDLRPGPLRRGGRGPFRPRRIVIVTNLIVAACASALLAMTCDRSRRSLRDLRRHRRFRGGPRIQCSGGLGALARSRTERGLPERRGVGVVVLAGGHDHRPRAWAASSTAPVGPPAVYERQRRSASIASGLVGSCACARGASRRRLRRGRRFVAGIRYVRKNRILLGSISLDLFAVLFGGASALLPVYASDVLHVGPRGSVSSEARRRLGPR